MFSCLSFSSVPAEKRISFACAARQSDSLHRNIHREYPQIWLRNKKSFENSSAVCPSCAIGNGDAGSSRLCNKKIYRPFLTICLLDISPCSPEAVDGGIHTGPTGKEHPFPGSDSS